MTRNEAEDEIRQLMTHLRMTNRQIEAFGVLLWDTDAEPLEVNVNPQVVVFDEAAQKIRAEFLRDEFAGRALMGRGYDHNQHVREIALWCYEMADAMLAERSGRNDLTS